MSASLDIIVSGTAFDRVIAGAAMKTVPKQGDWVARDFRFHTGEVLPEVKLHYRTIGEPTGEPVSVLHGTAGSGAGMLMKNFAEAMKRIKNGRYTICSGPIRPLAEVRCASKGAPGS